MFSPESNDTDEVNPLTRAYRDVVVYDGADPDDVLYEGPIAVHANGWLELEGNRLLSPRAVHHVAIYDDEADEVGGLEDGPDADSGADDDRRTGRFSPR